MPRQEQKNIHTAKLLERIIEHDCTTLGLVDNYEPPRETKYAKQEDIRITYASALQPGPP